MMNWTRLRTNGTVLAELVLLASLILISRPPSAAAQALPGRAEVRALQGSATYTTNGGPAQPIKVGMTLSQSAVIKTGPASTVDLFLGRSAGSVRVAENSTLSLEKLTLTETGADTAVDVQLHLPEGEMYFNVNKLSKASRYEIKLPTGVAGIRGTKGSFSFRPTGNKRPPVILLEGKLVFVHVPAGGAMQSYVMSAPPAVYFTATEGVKELPPALQQEVEKQLDEAEKKTQKNKDTAGKGQLPNPPQSPPTEPVLSPGTGVHARSPK